MMDMIKCHAKQVLLMEGEYDAIGFVFRNQHDAYVLYHSLGEMRVTRIYTSMAFLIARTIWRVPFKAILPGDFTQEVTDN
jgi:hypothetical protein